MSDDIEQLKEIARIKTEEAAEPPVYKMYTVNGSVTMAAWVHVEATSPEDALEQADDIAAKDWARDDWTAEIDMNVEPQVEVTQ